MNIGTLVWVHLPNKRKITATISGRVVEDSKVIAYHVTIKGEEYRIHPIKISKIR